MDASLVTYSPPWTSAVTRTLDIRLEDSLHAKDFGVLPTNSDNTLQLQAAINAAVTLGAELILPPGDLKFKTLTIGGSNVIIKGAGSTRLVAIQTNPSPANLITIANGTDEIHNVHLRDFSIWAEYTVPSGFAVLWQKAARCSMQNIKAGRPEDASSRLLAGGVHFYGFAECVIRDCLFWGNSGESIVVTGQPGFDAELVIDGHTFVSGSGSNGVHIAGRAGGVYLVSGGVASCVGNGVLIDTVLGGTFNREIFTYTGFAVDSCGLNGYLFDTNACTTFNGTGGWANGNGNVGFFVKTGQYSGAKFLLNGFIASDNVSNGLYLQDQALFAVGCQFARNGKTTSSNPGQWGVAAEGANARLGLTGCNISDNGKPSPTSGGGLLIQSSLGAFTVTGNSIYANNNVNVNTAPYNPTTAATTSKVFANNATA